MVIRLNRNAEPIEKLIADLENGSRQLSSAETALILRQMNDAVKQAQLDAQDSRHNISIKAG